MRVLDYILTSPDMAQIADHRRVTVTRGAVRALAFDCDMIVSHLAISWRTLPALLAIRLANRSTRFVHVEHSYTEAFVQHNVTNTGRFGVLLRAGFAIFDTIIAVSNAQADWFARGGYCPVDKIQTIRSCVDLSAFDQLERRPTRPRIIGAIGRLDRQKGFDLLIKGFRTLPDKDVALHIYGTGDEFKTLRDLAGGDPRITFKGFSPDPVRTYENVDMVVLPSRWEAYGLVAIEALCAQRIVLCADIDGLRDHKDYGAHLFNAHSPHAITETLAQMINTPPTASIQPSLPIGQAAERAFLEGWKTLIDAAH